MVRLLDRERQFRSAAIVRTACRTRSACYVCRSRISNCGASRAPRPRSPPIADDIAYDAHDIDDGLRAELFILDELAEVALAARASWAISAARYPHLDTGPRRARTGTPRHNHPAHRGGDCGDRAAPAVIIGAVGGCGAARRGHRRLLAGDGAGRPRHQGSFCARACTATRASPAS